MSFRVAQALALALELYALAGLVFAAGFLPRAIARVDPRVAAAPWTVRVLLLPGVAALWPMFAWRLAAARRGRT